MKKLVIAISFLILVIIFALPVSASAETKAGIKPGGFFYFFDTTFEKINLFFTFNPEKKAEKALGYANERLAEVQAIEEKENPDAIKTAITNYESNVALATEKSKEVKDKGQAENLLNLIADSTSKNQEVLSAVLIKVPEEAKQAITRAIEASRKGQEEATKQIAELKGEIEQLKQEVAELKEGKEQVSEIDKLKKEIEELSRQKPKTAPAPVKPSIPKTSETKPTPTPTPTISNDEGVRFKKDRIEQLSEAAEKLRFFIEEVRNNNITDIKVRRDKLLWKISIIRKDSFSGTDETATKLNRIFDLYAQMHEDEIRYIDKNLEYINYNLSLLEGYRTEYNTITSSLLENFQKVLTNEEMSSSIISDGNLFLRNFDPKSNIRQALINHYQSVINNEDLYARTHASIVDALYKMGESTNVSAPVYQPIPQIVLPIPEFPKTTRCTMGTIGGGGVELIVNCTTSSF